MEIANSKLKILLVHFFKATFKEEEIIATMSEKLSKPTDVGRLCSVN